MTSITISRPKFTELNNLSSDVNGATILFATDDFFAAAENMIRANEAENKEDLYDDFGKWMDGWETRRKRTVGHDWCIIKLGYPGIIHGIEIDTTYFTGNYPIKAQVQVAKLTPEEEALIPVRKNCFKNGCSASEADLLQASKLGSENWTILVPKQKLGAGYPETAHNYFPVDNHEAWTHLRVNMYPDGGIARLRVYGQVSRDLKSILSSTEKSSLVDLIAMENGGVCLVVSNAHYGHPRNIILRGRPKTMRDGWETARRLDRPDVIIADPKTGVLQIPGNEWGIFRLGLIGKIVKLEIDTLHFKGNFPDTVKLEYMNLKSLTEESNINEKSKWKTLLLPKKLGPNQIFTFEGKDILQGEEVITHVKVTIVPDGGLARLRLWGIPSAINLLS